MIYWRSVLGQGVFLHVLIIRRVWGVDLRNEKHMIDAVVYSLCKFLDIKNKPVLNLFHLTVIVVYVDLNTLSSTLPHRNILLCRVNLSLKVALDLLFAWQHLIQFTFEYRQLLNTF